VPCGMPVAVGVAPIRREWRQPRSSWDATCAHWWPAIPIAAAALPRGRPGARSRAGQAPWSGRRGRVDIAGLSHPARIRKSGDGAGGEHSAFRACKLAPSDAGARSPAREVADVIDRSRAGSIRSPGRRTGTGHRDRSPEPARLAPAVGWRRPAAPGARTLIRRPCGSSRAWHSPAASRMKPISPPAAARPGACSSAPGKNQAAHRRSAPSAVAEAGCPTGAGPGSISPRG
jgi:hypothetical protein